MTNDELEDRLLLLGFAKRYGVGMDSIMAWYWPNIMHWQIWLNKSWSGVRIIWRISSIPQSIAGAKPLTDTQAVWDQVSLTMQQIRSNQLET